MSACTSLCAGLFLTVSGLMASPASAQTLTIPLRAGDPVSGMGAVTGIGNVFVDDSGAWFAGIETDFPDSTRNGALLRNGVVLLREGEPLPEPVGASIGRFESHWSTGDSLALIMTLQPLGTETGLYWKTQLVVQEGGIIDDPGMPTGSRWTDLDAVKMNKNRTMLICGDLDTSSVSGQNESFVGLLRVSPLGQLLETRILMRKGAPHPAFSGNVIDVLDLDHAIALNDRGDYMTIGRGSGLNAGAILINDIPIAREGQPSPISGRNYTALYPFSEVDINDFGDYVFTGQVVGDGGVATNIALIVKNGAVLAQEGDVLAGLGPLGDLTSAPIYLANSGDVFWVAPTSAGNALMRNLDPLLRVGDILDGRIITSVGLIPGSFHASDDGRFWVGKVVLDSDEQALVALDLGLLVPIPGCSGNTASLRLASGLSLAGHDIELALDGAQAVGAVPVVKLALAPAVGRPGCGVVTAQGELLISPPTVFGSVTGPAWNGSASSIVIAIPDHLSLVGLTYYAQGFFWDAANQLPGENVRLTNAIRGEIGAP